MALTRKESKENEMKVERDTFASMTQEQQSLVIFDSIRDMGSRLTAIEFKIDSWKLKIACLATLASFVGGFIAIVTKSVWAT